jgi:hypothetical protein
MMFGAQSVTISSARRCCAATALCAAAQLHTATGFIWLARPNLGQVSDEPTREQVDADRAALHPRQGPGLGLWLSCPGRVLEGGGCLSWVGWP